MLNNHSFNMMKRFKRHPEQCEKEQLGCMWGLISMFDFRQSHSTRKLISDRRHGNRHGVGHSKRRLSVETSFDKKCQDIDDDKGSQRLSLDVDNTSVKILIEEEMSSTEQSKKHINGIEEQIQSVLEHRDHFQKACKQTKKICKSTCDIHAHALKDDAASLGSQGSSDPHLVKQSANNLDLGAVIEEFFSQIHQYQEIWLHCENGNDSSEVQRGIDCAKHEQLDELSMQLIQKQSALQGILGEATDLFINQKFITGKNLTQDGASHHPKQFMDTLEILNSNNELLLKLLQDPNSLLVKHIQDLWKAEAGNDGATKSLAGGNLSDMEIIASRQFEQLICHKQFWKHNSHDFFHKRIKSQDRNSSRGSDDPQTSNSLKPGQTGMYSSETGTNPCSYPPSHNISRNNEERSRTKNRFSFREIKRKLKEAMGESRKEQSHKTSEIQGTGNSAKTVAEEIAPSKAYDNTEKNGNCSISVERGDKVGASKDCEPNISLEVAATSDDGCKNSNVTTVTTIVHATQRESNIYIGAKKHISENLITGDEDEDFSSTQVPETLGRMLSLPEYNLSPVFSPGRDKEYCFVNVQMTSKNMWLKEEENVTLASPLKQNLVVPPRTDDNKPEKELQVFNSNSDISKELRPDIEIHVEGACSVESETSPTGGVKTFETTDPLCPGMSSVFDVSSLSNSTPVTYTNQRADTAHICEGRRYPECSRLNLLKDDEPPSSPLDTFSPNFNIHEVEDLSNTNDRQERPSPVSVLEPFFTDDVGSPPSPISQPAERPMQPLRIHFDEHDFFVESHSNSDNYLTTSIADNKSTFEYVRAVLQASDLSWDIIFEKWHSSDQLLDLSLFDQVEVSVSFQFCEDRRLLFDCINEVLVDLCKHHLGCSPWVLFVNPNSQLIAMEKNVVHEVCKGIDLQLSPQLPPHTLDQLVGKDMVKAGSWMDLQFDTEHIGNKIGEVILDVLLKDTIFELCTSSPETLLSFCCVVQAREKN